MYSKSKTGIQVCKEHVVTEDEEEHYEGDSSNKTTIKSAYA